MHCAPSSTTFINFNIEWFVARCAVVHIKMLLSAFCANLPHASRFKFHLDQYFTEQNEDNDYSVDGEMENSKFDVIKVGSTTGKSSVFFLLSTDSSECLLLNEGIHTIFSNHFSARSASRNRSMFPHVVRY